MKHWIGVAIFISISSIKMYAQKNVSVEKSVDSLKTHHLEDIVVTAQYEPNTAEKSTYKVKVIGSEKMNSIAAVNLKDALSNELNIRFSQDPVLGGGMSLQGLSGQNVKILIDGVPVIGRQNGNIDLSQINISDVERIEVIEGPMAVSYGTNALAGVINIITKKPKEKTLSLASNLYYETNHNYNAGVTVSSNKKSHGFSLSFNRNYFNGWNIDDKFYLIPEKTLADTNRFKSWKPKEQYFGDLQYQYKRNTFTLNYKLSLFDELIINRGFPQRPYFEAAFDDYYKTQRFDNSISFNKKFENFKSLSNVIAFNYYKRTKNTYYKDLTNLGEQIASDNSLQDTAVFKQVMARGTFLSAKPYQTWDDTLKTIHRFNYEIGYDLNYTEATGQRILGKTKTMLDAALFASSEIKPLNSLVIRPGIRYGYNSSYIMPVIPSLNIKYALSNWTFRASYARGFRAPDLKELYFEFVDINHNISGNTNLKAEQSDNFNFSSSYNYKTPDADYMVDLSGFNNSIQNLITLAQASGNQYSYINIGKFKSHGASLNFTYKYKSLVLSSGVSYTGRYNDLSTNYNVDEFSYTPELRSSAQYKFRKIATSVNCFFKYTGKLPGFAADENGNITSTYINDFSMLDGNVSKQFFNEKLIITTGAKNILNINNVQASISGGVHSGNSSSTPIAMGRTYFIKLQYVFN